MISKSSAQHNIQVYLKNYRQKKHLSLLGQYLQRNVFWFFLIWLVFYHFHLLLSFFDSYFFQSPLVFISGVFIPPVIIYRKIIKKIFKQMNLSEIACEIERSNSFSGKLISSADFMEKEYSHNPYLETAYIDKTFSEMKRLNIPFPGIKLEKQISLYSSLLAVIIIILSIFIKQSPYLYLKEMFLSQEGSIAFHLDYPAELENGKDFVLKIKTSLKNVKLFSGFSPENMQYTELERTVNSNGNEDNVFTYTSSQVTRDIYFSVVLRKGKHVYRQPVQRVFIYTLPVIRNLELIYTPPAIYGMPAKVIKDTGNVEGFYNSQITINAEFTNPLKRAEIFFLRSNKILPMKISGTKAALTFNLTGQDEYKIRVVDVHEHENINPPVFSIIPLTDKPPVLNIISPNRDIVSRNTDFFHLKLNASDDYGILKLLVELKKFEKKDSVQPLFSKKREYLFNAIKEIQQEIKISLIDITVNPGEMVKYRVSIIDTGRNSVSSRWFTITFPGLFERLARMDRDRENISNRLSRILDEQRRVRDEMRQIQEKIRSGSATAQEINKLKQLIKEQTQIFNRMNRESNRIERMREEMAANPELRDRALASRLEEINKLLREVLSGSAREALEKMQKMLNRMQNNTGQQQESPSSEQDMSNYVKRLERTIELLRLLKKYQRLIAARILLKNMKNRLSGTMDHIGLAGDTLNSIRVALGNASQPAATAAAPSIAAARSRTSVESPNDIRSNAAGGRVSAVQRNNPVNIVFPEFIEVTKKAGVDLETDRNNFTALLGHVQIPALQNEIDSIINTAKSDIKRNIESLINGNARAGNIVSLEMGIEQLLARLNKMIKSMSGSNLERAKKFVHRLINELIHFSGSSLLLRDKIKRVKSGYMVSKDVRLSWAEEIQFAQSKISERGKTFLQVFEGIIRDMNQFEGYFTYLTKKLGLVAGSLTNNKILSAERNISEYKKLHNQFILILTQLYHQLSNIKPRQGMQQSSSDSLNSLAEMQRRLNEQVQRLWGKVRSGNLSPNERSYLERLSQRQQELSERMGRILGGNSETVRRARAALEAIRREMQQVAREMQQNRVPESVIASQRRILRRMLDSERGLESRERDDRRRRGETSQENRFGDTEETRRLYIEFMKKMKLFEMQKLQNLPKYYQELIRQYSETLRKLMNP